MDLAKEDRFREEKRFMVGQMRERYKYVMMEMGMKRGEEREWQ